ncbi:zinc finger protein 800-like isoform X2 [Crotalus tigris]|uniref:zinc finger protein 800-like isoform X2 n=1 Tax=Crotalus tigris TaxID=88082 RepID=UPI00192FA914|nr:zinc finger protein 800-like isoform X2 [Crotalus tigris]
MPLRDKYCQTDYHHGCCEPVRVLEPGDPPLLQQPFHTSKSGIQQIIECFRSDSPDTNDKQSQAITDLLEAMYPRVNKQDYTIRLEPIETNQNAVFQYVSKADSSVENSDTNTVPDQASVGTPEHATEPPKPVSDASETKTEETPPLVVDKIIPTPEESAQCSKPELECDNNSESGHQLICSLCKKEFHSRRSVRRHIRKVHKKKMEELKKFIQIKKRPNQTSGRGRNKNVLVTLGKSCPLCIKSFATKANVRRHFDEVHRGLRRDSITPDIATKPGQPLSLDKSSAKTAKTQKQKSSKAEYNLTTCKCLLCKRKYSSQVMLKRHMQIVHKITLSTKNPKRERKPNAEVKVKIEPAESAESMPSSCSSLQNEIKGINNANERKHTSSTERKNAVSSEKRKTPTERKGISSTGKKNVTPARKKKVRQSCQNSKSNNQSLASGLKKPRKPRLSVGFDFKKLYCKLCKRQFTSKQNLTKHIELHTDGNNIYVKFYRCPLCTYETRRKRDVIRHITVVHKKSSRYLGKITASLEIRAIKKPIDCILNKVAKRGPQREEGKQNGSKQDITSNSPNKKYEGTDVGIEVKVTKNFSLHRCNKCGKAFAKKTFLEHHKKTHKANVSHSPEEDNKTKGRSTRSKALVC